MLHGGQSAGRKKYRRIFFRYFWYIKECIQNKGQTKARYAWFSHISIIRKRHDLPLIALSGTIHKQFIGYKRNKLSVCRLVLIGVYIISDK